MRYYLPLVAVAFGVLACSGDDGPSEPNPPEGDIIVGNNFFNPTAFNASAGAPVVWAWAAGAVDHNVTFDDDAPGSATQSSGTFQRTFSDAGGYPYHCTIHGEAVMSGVVNVAAAGGLDGDGGAGGGSGGGGSGGTPNPY